MATAKTSTPLMAVLRACESDDERQALAEFAGTTVNYLYALAGCHRGQPRVGLAVGIASATREFNRRTDGRIPAISVEDIATMCAVHGLDSE